LGSSLPFDGLVTAIYIVQVTVNDRIEHARDADDRVADADVAPPAARAVLLREISEGVAALASRRRCAAARRIHHSGISLGHLQILWILQEHGPLPVSRLADWLGIGVPNVTGLLDRMEQRGLVERVRDTEDRRVVLARPSDLGRAAVAEHDGWQAEVLTQLLAPLTTEQLAAVADRMRDACAAPISDAPVVPAADASPHPQPTTPRRGPPAR
jgi:DNA-binding MarR family transcriptional regulator